MRKLTNKASQHKIDLRALKESEARFRSIVLWSVDAIIVTDAKGKIEYMNPAAERVFNRKVESFIGKDFGLPLVDGESTEIDIFRPGKDPGVGDMHVVETEWLNKKVHLITIRDITERKKAEERVTELSIKDTHTELYNYRYLMERLESEVNRARRYVLPVSVIMLDIDYFKSINDVYGHQCGDMIIKEFAQCLKDFARNVDIVTRYGGEEFVVVLPDTNKNGAIIFGKRLLDAIGKHLFDPEGKSIKLKVSIGLSSFPEDGGDTGTASGLINSADKALLNAKEKGGNRLCLFKDIGKDIKDIVEKGVKENVDKLKEKLSKMSDRVDNTLLESVYAFAKTIQVKDHYTGEHAENMVSIVVAIGEKLHLPAGVIKNLSQAAILHDLGKVGVPDHILHKKGKLTKEEYEIIKKHPQTGAEIIRPIHFLDKLVPIILYHHERFDGLGYSAGLKGKEIPLGARIVAIADAYQALVSDRPYRKAYSEEEALDIIREGSGTQFDPEIVSVFLRILKHKNNLSTPRIPTDP